MFGILTKIKECFNVISGGKISNDIRIRKLMSDFRADEFGHRASITKADLGYGWVHYGFVRQIKPKNILCIGSRHGYIPAILAQACKENLRGHVDFVDPGFGPNSENSWTGVGYWVTQSGKEVFSKSKLSKHITQHTMTSEEFLKKSKKTYQYIYIDGDHSFKGAMLDYKNCWKKLDAQGFMVFHDICVSGKRPDGVYGVNKVWSKISQKNSIVFNFKGSGLGVIQKR